MKVKQKSTSKRGETPLGIKYPRVNLTRLSQGTIRKYTENVVDCNLYLNIKEGKVVAVRDSGTKIPMTITVKSIISKPPKNRSKYNLRATEKATEKETNEKKPAKNCLAVAVIGAAARKNQLWSLAKKKQEIMKR